MLYLKTATLNNKQNRKLLQSDLWSSSRLISELDYSIMTVSFSWTIKEYPVPVSSEAENVEKVKSVFSCLLTFVQFSIFLGVNEVHQKILTIKSLLQRF